MRAVIGACAGHALCHAVAPDVYDLDELGQVIPPGRIPAARERDAEEGAAACPERAISVVAD